MKEMPSQMQHELAESKDKVLKMPVVVNDNEYRPSYTIGAEYAEDVPPCLCCGAQGGGWIQCVEKIIEHGTDDARIMQEIESKLKTIVREIEEGMSVCENCNYTEEFIQHRPDLYKEVFKKVLQKYNNKEYSTDW